MTAQQASLLQFSLCPAGHRPRGGQGTVAPASPVRQLWNSSALSMRKVFPQVPQRYRYSPSTWTRRHISLAGLHAGQSAPSWAGYTTALSPALPRGRVFPSCCPAALKGEPCWETKLQAPAPRSAHSSPGPAGISQAGQPVEARARGQGAIGLPEFQLLPASFPRPPGHPPRSCCACRRRAASGSPCG